VILPLFSGDARRVLEAARDAERLGFDGVFAYDHLFPPGAPPDRPALEAFTTLGAVAASTSRVAVGTLVTRAGLRAPGYLGKLAATLDWLSDGRAILGIGSGDPIDRGEHRAFGFPELGVEDRRAALEETAAALESLFHGRAAQGGRWVSPIEGPLLPPPVRPGGPPIWLGARAEAVVRIAARVADGWNGWGMDVATFAARAELLRTEAEAAGRPGAVEATWAGIALVGEDEGEVERLLEERRSRNAIDDLSWSGTAEAFARHLHELARTGATWAVVVLAGPAGRRSLVAERVLPLLEA
jgi:alkanesulfonate monooxygenase SsuD/methylene tetrahydromethanopterin reductase-like flavin-dependent oxidoreductase (luciferase family)